MLLLRRILVSPFVLAVSAVTLAACGQQGPLYLPTDPPPGKRPAAQPYSQPNAQPAAPMPADSATSATPGARPASQ